MLTLRTRPKVEPPPGDAIDLLLACHARIRHFTTLAGKLVEAREAAPAMIAEAARSLGRYFGVALPLHVADEDVSIALRIEGRPTPLEVRAALDEMIGQHAAIDRLLEELLPSWRAIEAAPDASAALDAAREGLAARTPPLATFLSAHLALEEAAIFPWLRAALGAEGLAALAEEMRLRRVGTWIPEPAAAPAPADEGGR